MSNNILLEELIPPLAPDHISYLPTTIGWQVLALIIGGLILYQIVFFGFQYHKNRYRRVAILKLKQVMVSKHENSLWVITVINQILKECAQNAFPSKNVLALNSNDWLAFLTETGGGAVFTQPLYQDWQLALYQPKRGAEVVMSNAKLLCLFSIVSQWIENHVGE